MNKLLTSTFFCVTIAICSFAQHNTKATVNKAHMNSVSTEFCSGINKIIADAPNKFKNISGKQTQIATDDVEWECNIKTSDSLTGHIVFGAGIWTDYIGTLFSSSGRADAFDMYNKYREALSACLNTKGYIGEPSKLDHFWRSSDSKVLKYRVIDANFVLDNSMPTITLELDSSYTRKNTRSKQYWITLDVWGLENYQ